MSVLDGPKENESSEGVKTVAIKLISKQDRPRIMRERARDEINIWRDLKHDNIVRGTHARASKNDASHTVTHQIQYYDVKETPQAIWIICQPALGGDLRNRLSNSERISLDSTESIIRYVSFI